MQITHSEAPVIAENGRVDSVLSRNVGELWVVWAGPAHADYKPAFELSKTGSAFRVPLVPYVVTNTPSALAAFFVEVGSRAMAGYLASKGAQPVLEMHIVRGATAAPALSDSAMDLEPGAPSTVRMHIGLAFRVKHKV